MYRANNSLDIKMLAKRLRAVPASAHPALAASIVDLNLMIPKGFWTKAIIWVLRLREPRFLRLAAFYSRMPDMASELVEDTARWAITGRDSNVSSRGGFCQAELDQLEGLLDAIDAHRKAAA